MAHIDSQAKELLSFLSQATKAFETRMYRRAVPVTLPRVQPYQFLLPFEIEDADFFFGRDEAREDFYQALLKDRLTILHAKSGAGKTSLLNAGLSPRLIREGRLPVYVRVYREPIRAIKQAITPPSLEPWPDLMSGLSLHQYLRLVCDHLSRQTQELVLILDQFEDYLIFWPEREHWEGFIDALFACYDDESLPVRTLIALRKDYFSDLARFQDRMPTILHNEFWLDNLTKGEAWEAITGPAKKLTRPVVFESALLDALLSDLTRDALLLAADEDLDSSLSGVAAPGSAEGVEPWRLQIICDRLHQTLTDDEPTISLAAYEKMGRTEGILGDFLRDILAQMPEGEASIARRILSELVSSHGTRRVLSERSLAAQIDTEGSALAGVLDCLVNERLLSMDHIAGEIVYELAHDRLIEQISGWIDRSDRALKRAQELLAREVEIWRTRGTLISREQLGLLHRHGDWLKGLDSDALRCLLRSSLNAAYSIEYWAGLLGESGQELLVEALSDERDYVRRAALRSLGKIQNRQELVDLGDEDPDARQAGAWALGELAEAWTLAPLISTLDDQQENVRRTAAEALGKLGDPQARERLLVALEDQEPSVRQSVTEALGRLGDPQAEEALGTALHDQDPSVRRAAVRALGAIWGLPALIKLGDEDRQVSWAGARELASLGDPRTVAPLITVLRDEHSSVRRAATGALATLGQPAVEPLIIALKDENWLVREAAAEVLGEIGDHRALQPLFLALRDEHRDVRQTAALALAKLGEAAVEPLISALEGGEGDERCKAALALGELGDSRAVGPLGVALRDIRNDVRGAASEALVSMGKRSLGVLTVALRDQDPFVRQTAADALGEIGEPEATDFLIDALADDDREVRRAAATALQKLDDPRAVEPFIAALQDADRYVRRQAAWALGEIADPRASEPLITALADEDRGVRQAASTALVKLGESTVDLLTAALQDADAGLRWTISGVLGQLGDRRAVMPLTVLLEDDDRVVRRAAAAALGKIGDPRAVEPLIAALLDRESGVRWAATEALGELHDPRAVDALIATLDDEDTSVRRAAATALRNIGTPKALSALE